MKSGKGEARGPGQAQPTKTHAPEGSAGGWPVAPPRAMAILGLATFTQVGASFAQQGLAVLATYLRAEEHLNLALLGTLESAVTLGVAASMIPSGASVDRWGVGRTTVLGALGIAAGFAFARLVIPGPVASLYPFLLAVGVFTALVPMSGSRAVMASFPQSWRGSAMGIRQAGVTVGVALAAAVLPSLAQIWAPRDVLAALGIPVLLGSLGLGVMAGPVAQGMPSPGAHPDASASSFRPRQALVQALPVAVVGGLLSSGQYAMLSYMLPYLHDQVGLPLVAAGILLSLVQLGGTVGRVAFGAVSDRWRSRGRTVALVSLLACLGVAGFALLGKAPVAILGGELFVTGLGVVGWNALVLTWAAERAVRVGPATAMGAAGAAVFMGATLWPPLFGLVAQRLGSFTPAWLGVAGLYAMGFLWAWQVSRSSLPRQRPPGAALRAEG
jgi:MFS family permease